MKKDIPYREQLLELSKLYKVPEVKSYIKSKKNLTTSQLELILLKNKIPLPAQSYSRKHVAEIKFKEQVITNLILTIALLGFITSLITIRPYIKIVTDEIKFTHVAKEYKSNFTDEKQLSKNDLVSSQELRTIEKEIDKEIKEAVEFALESADPDPKELTKYIWAEEN